MPDVTVLDSTMHFTEVLSAAIGSGAPGSTPVVFLHGNPSSSHCWRNVLPAVGAGTLLAPDLIGMGASGKPDLVLHLRGSCPLPRRLVRRRPGRRAGASSSDTTGAAPWRSTGPHGSPQRVRGTALFEAVLRPVRREHLSPQARARSELIASPQGEVMFLDQDTAIRQAYSFGVMNPLPDEDLAPYLAPYPSRGESPAPAGLGTSARRTTDRAGRAARGCGHVAGGIRRRAEAPAHVRQLTDPADRRESDHLGAGASGLRRGRAPRVGGPSRDRGPPDRDRRARIGSWLDRHALR